MCCQNIPKSITWTTQEHKHKQNTRVHGKIMEHKDDKKLEHKVLVYIKSIIKQLVRKRRHRATWAEGIRGLFGGKWINRKRLE